MISPGFARMNQLQLILAGYSEGQPGLVIIPLGARICSGVSPQAVDTPEICTFSECSARAPFPYTPARKSKNSADLHRGDSFVLQRRAITTADGGSEEETEEEEELGPDAAAAEPPAAPCALRGGGRGRGRGGAAAAAAARALPPSGAPSAASRFPPPPARELSAGLPS